MNIIVFSRDRACQLDLFLRSLDEYWPSHDWVTVLYLSTAPDFTKAYELTMERHPVVIYLDEDWLGFKTSVRTLVRREDPQTVFFTDDDVLKEYVIADVTRLNDETLACLSLRVHPGLTESYSQSRPIPKPDMQERGGGYAWNWTAAQGDYGYPMSLDGHIYRTRDIAPYVDGTEYYNPNTMEGRWSTLPLCRPHMWCQPNAPVLNIPWNRVQTANTNHCGTITAEHLNDEYLTGKRLSMDGIRGYQNASCHVEMPVKWEVIDG